MDDDYKGGMQTSQERTIHHMLVLSSFSLLYMIKI